MNNATKIVYDQYGTDKYLGAIGLSVTPEYRGHGLGTYLLKMRYVFCIKMLLIKLRYIYTYIFLYIYSALRLDVQSSRLYKRNL